jgi:two-component system sensor histidine kinase CreC
MNFSDNALINPLSIVDLIFAQTEKLNAKLKTEIKGREYAERYIRTIRHEIVNHLTSMDFSAQNMLELKIKDKILTTKINSIIEDINETDELTKRLVELADLEKKNRLENIEKVNVKSFIKEALNDQYIQEKLELKNINIEYKINPKFDINFEKLLAKRAFLNIVNNAADFTLKNSTITIKVNESNTHTNILVLDQGAGLLPDAKDKIFKELCYSTARPDTGKKSTGLGLHFVKQIMSLHSGRASLDNNSAGVGSVATLSFPIK